jgi:hypothetical protein
VWATSVWWVVQRECVCAGDGQRCGGLAATYDSSAGRGTSSRGGIYITKMRRKVLGAPPSALTPKRPRPLTSSSTAIVPSNDSANLTLRAETTARVQRVFAGCPSRTAARRHAPWTTALVVDAGVMGAELAARARPANDVPSLARGYRVCKQPCCAQQYIATAAARVDRDIQRIHPHSRFHDPV